MWKTMPIVLAVGYLCLSRSFAYFGIPVWNVFVGEVALAIFLLSGPKIGQSSWLRFTLKLQSLRKFWIWYGVFLGYGVIQVVYGIQQGHPPLSAMRDLALHYYPLYFLLGLWVGATHPELLPRLLRGFAWCNGLYGVAYILFLNRVQWFVPGVSQDVGAVPLFGQPIFSFVAILGILAYQKDLRRSWHLLLLNGFVMMVMQVRTEWLALGIGVFAWSIITKQSRLALQACAAVASLFLFLYITNLSLPSPEGRTDDVDFSARQLVDRTIAPFRADVSNPNALASGAADPQEGTLLWRAAWWLAIWDSAHTDSRTALIGHGYGYALGDLFPYLEDETIRTPHNVFFYTLGYTGWIGVSLFFLFELQILRLLWQSKEFTGDAFGATLWVALIAFSLFTPLFETPYGAIPFYLITGLAGGPGVVASRRSRDDKGRIALAHWQSHPDGCDA
jgi:hypothetical protein